MVSFWEKVFELLNRWLDKALLAFSVKTVVDQNNKIKDLERNDEIRKDSEAIKERNSKLSRDELIDSL